MQSDPKYEDYQQVIQNNTPVGFKLKNDPFFYKYDQHGGWFDAEGKYFNKDAINCEPIYQSDSEDQDQDQDNNTLDNENKLLQKDMDTTNLRHQTVRALLEILDSYPNNQLVQIEIYDQKDSIRDKDLQNLIDQKVQFQNLTAKVGKKTADKLIRLQGKKLGNTSIYVYVKLFNGRQISTSTKLSRNEFVSQLEKLQLVKNKDYANIENQGNGFTLQMTESGIQQLSKIKDKVVVDMC